MSAFLFQLLVFLVLTTALSTALDQPSNYPKAERPTKMGRSGKIQAFLMATLATCNAIREDFVGDFRIYKRMLCRNEKTHPLRIPIPSLPSVTRFVDWVNI